MAKLYKHALSVSGQLFFCAAPIRLDAYDGCEFGCVYCFSRRRARRWASPGIHEASSQALAKRFERVKAGNLASALDEFLAERVPLQLGGLHDPFTPRESRRGVTRQLLEVLRIYEYPVLISTKGDIVVEPTYLALLKEMNVVVRFSAAGVADKFRASIDRRCSSYEYLLEKFRFCPTMGCQLVSEFNQFCQDSKKMP
jgi:DNA repair photolyase